jgi:putative two-component system response regulator
MPTDQAVKLILEGRGSHFDPDIVDVFEALSDELSEMAHRLGSDARK